MQALIYPLLHHHTHTLTVHEGPCQSCPSTGQAVKRGHQPAQQPVWRQQTCMHTNNTAAHAAACESVQEQQDGKPLTLLSIYCYQSPDNHFFGGD